MGISEGIAQPGAEFAVTVKLAIKPGWHIYANPTGVAELNPTTTRAASRLSEAVHDREAGLSRGRAKGSGLVREGEGRALREAKSRSRPVCKVAEDAKPGAVVLQVSTDLPGLQRPALPGAGRRSRCPLTVTVKTQAITAILRALMSKTITRIGPADHGRPMELDEFAEAEAAGRAHSTSWAGGSSPWSRYRRSGTCLQVAAARDQLQAYKSSNPGRIEVIASGNECKLMIVALRSERHPDLAVYLTPPPEDEDDDFWMRWVPEIVVEVVSPSSRDRDYDEKPEEYLRAGVKEYWIVDSERRALIVMRRSRGRWTETKVCPPAIYRTRLLPGLAFSIESVFTSAGLA